MYSLEGLTLPISFCLQSKRLFNSIVVRHSITGRGEYSGDNIHGQRASKVDTKSVDNMISMPGEFGALLDNPWGCP